METTTTPPLHATDAELYARLAYELRRLAAVATGITHSITVTLWIDGVMVRPDLEWSGSTHRDWSGNGCRTAGGKRVDTVLDALADEGTELTDRIDDLRQRANAMLAEANELEANA
jgi:hypothetical protein